MGAYTYIYTLSYKYKRKKNPITKSLMKKMKKHIGKYGQKTNSLKKQWTLKWLENPHWPSGISDISNSERKPTHH